MEAIVLAGGKGTRLRSVVSNLPKPMAPVGGSPFLSHLFNFLIKNHVSKVYLSVSYMAEKIVDFYGNKYKSLDIDYCYEDLPLGTGGAIKKSFAMVKGDCCFVLNGDTYFDIDLNKLSLKQSSDICIALKYMQNFDRYGSICFDEDMNITRFKEKTFVKEGYINGGIYLISKSILSKLPKQDSFSFEEFLEKSFLAVNASCHCFTDTFVDIGIPNDYFLANKLLTI